MTSKKSKFKLRPNDTIGAAGAEEDSEFLSDCFVDTGLLETIENCDDIRQIVIGRTGAGKSALLMEIKRRHFSRIIEIVPENLALTYVSNSRTIQFFSNLGVNLDPFYKLLWRHVLVVEVLKKFFEDNPDPRTKNFKESLRMFFTGSNSEDSACREAIKYLESWDNKFWEQREYKVKEITQKMEDDLCSSASFKIDTGPANAKFSLSDKTNLTETQKAEIVESAQQVVANAQVQDLSKIIKLLDRVLRSKNKSYLILIDGLDENWVEERVRYKLILALILTCRELKKVGGAKAIVSMRKDLLERVFRKGRDSGFQEEKYESLYIRVNWNKTQLLDVLNKRLNHLVRRRYTQQIITFKDLLPDEFEKARIPDVIGKITTRPRDIIDFFNKCILSGADKSRLASGDLRLAIGEYSKSRLKALADEWSGDFPDLLDYTSLIKRKPYSFKIQAVSKSDVEEVVIEILAMKGAPPYSGISKFANEYMEDKVGFEEFITYLMRVFYKVGLVGLKTQTYEKESWADELGSSISRAEMDVTTSVVVHPMYHRALGIPTNWAAQHAYG